MYNIISFLCASNSISIAQMCKDIGLRQGLISDLKHGRSKSLSATNMQKIANYFQVSTDIFAEGVFEETLPNNADVQLLKEIYHKLTIKKEPSNADGYNLPSNILPMPEMRQIPLIGTIACGQPILAEENIEEYIEIPKRIKADFALTCKGDSMINARVFDGDIVYIRKQDTVENGEIAAVLIDNEATLKRVRLFNDHIVLEPENPQYRPLSFWGEDMNTVRILGKAVAFTSSIR